jgi:hypothetical protein
MVAVSAVRKSDTPDINMTSTMCAFDEPSINVRASYRRMVKAGEHVRYFIDRQHPFGPDRSSVHSCR